METFGVSELVHGEHYRRSETINRQAWKFGHVRKPDRGRLMLAAFRRELMR